MAYNGYGGYNSYPYTYSNPYQQPAQPYNQPVMPQMQQAPVQQPQQPVQPQMQAVPPKSNMIFVTSAEDALNRPAEFNTEIVYFHQSENFGFQVKTDMQGKKALQPFKMTPCTIEEMQAEIQGVTQAQMKEYVTKEQFDERMTAIETKIDGLTTPKSTKATKTTATSESAD